MIECVPTASDDVLQVATGAVSTLPMPHASVAVPSLKATAPVAPVGDTVAVSVIVTPASAGALLEVTTTDDAVTRAPP